MINKERMFEWTMIYIKVIIEDGKGIIQGDDRGDKEGNKAKEERW